MDIWFAGHRETEEMLMTQKYKVQKPKDAPQTDVVIARTCKILSQVLTTIHDKDRTIG